jgi:hypothetical protein
MTTHPLRRCWKVTSHVSRFPRPSEVWLLRLVALAVVAAVAIG